MSTLPLRLAAAPALALAGPRHVRAVGRPSLADIARQIALFALGMVVYFGVRGLTQTDIETASAHARTLVDFEVAVGAYVEPAIQRSVAEHGWAIDLANWIYIWGHWPVIFAILSWLLLRRPAAYYVVRNAFLLSGLIGVVIFVLYPVAPPRLMPELGLVDTVTLQSQAYRVLQPPAFVNQYAALPSLHVGWDLLVGIALYQQARHRTSRALGVVAPVLMTAAVVVTANHYVVDAVLGTIVALTGLWLALRLRDSAQRGAEPVVTTV